MKSIEIPYEKKSLTIDRFRFECGRILSNIDICYECWGKLNDSKDNAILITHALTGTSHAAASDEKEDPGWWNILVGAGKPFDTEKYFVICTNVIGGCSGSSGPSSLDSGTNTPYGINFPVVTIRDMVRVQKRLIDYLRIGRLHSIAGGSMGGMQALEWAVLYPDRVESIIPIAAPGRAYPQSIAYRKAQRKAIVTDPDWCGGYYYGITIPRKGIELARLIGFISYRTEREFAERFGRSFTDCELLDLEGRFEIEAYLENHGKRLAQWFDANSYIYLSKAMDLHDLGYGFSSYEQGVQRIKAATLMIGFDSDILFPAYQQKEVIDILSKTNPYAYYREIATLYGHDAFLIEENQLSEIIDDFLQQLPIKRQEKINEISDCNHSCRYHS